MYIGRVIGTVVATVKHPVFEGRKLLLVERLTPEGQETDRYDIAVDTVQSGSGDLVLVIDEGNSARQVINQEDAPIRAVIVGVIDQLDVQP